MVVASHTVRRGMVALCDMSTERLKVIECIKIGKHSFDGNQAVVKNIRTNANDLFHDHVWFCATLRTMA